MIKLTNILNEGKIVITAKDNKAELPSNFVDFQVSGGRQTYEGRPVFQFIPKSSKDLDKIDQLGDTPKRDISKQLAIYAMKKTKLKFEPFDRYEGAGFGIILNIQDILRKLK